MVGHAEFFFITEREVFIKSNGNLGIVSTHYLGRKNIHKRALVERKFEGRTIRRKRGRNDDRGKKSPSYFWGAKGNSGGTQMEVFPKVLAKEALSQFLPGRKIEADFHGGGEGSGGFRMQSFGRFGIWGKLCGSHL